MYRHPLEHKLVQVQLTFLLLPIPQGFVGLHHIHRNHNAIPSLTHVVSHD